MNASRFDTTKDVTDYDPPSLLTPLPVTMFNQTAATGFVTANPTGKEGHLFASPMESDLYHTHMAQAANSGKIKSKKQLNKTFTDFKSSPIH